MNKPQLFNVVITNAGVDAINDKILSMYMNYRYLLCIVFIGILIITLYSIETVADSQDLIGKRTIENDGFCVLYDPEYIRSVSSGDSPSRKLHADALAQLPPGYVFVDYIYKISDAALSTFHRDVTSSQHVYDTVHPIYTLILYKYSGDLLSLCPGSHASYPFVWSPVVNVRGRKGTAFLFNSDLLHAGQKNGCKDREVVQYKLSHLDDLPKLHHLHGIRANKADVCTDTLYQSVVRKLSYFFEMPINICFYPMMIKREDNNTFLGKIQSFIPLTYYNNV